MKKIRFMVFLETALFLAIEGSTVFCQKSKNTLSVQTNPAPTEEEKKPEESSEGQEDELEEEAGSEPVTSSQVSKEVYKKYKKATDLPKKKKEQTLPEKCTVNSQAPSVVKIIHHVGAQLHKTTVEDSNAASETAPVPATPSIKGTRGPIHQRIRRETFSKEDQTGKTIFKKDFQESQESIEKKQLLETQHSLPMNSALAGQSPDLLDRPTDKRIKNDSSFNSERIGKRVKHGELELGDR